jgi:SagB-type dehydrogenase family enzyme
MSVRVCRCRALSIEIEGGVLVARNHRTRSHATLDYVDLAVLRATAEPIDAEALFEELESARETVARAILRLLDASLLLVDGSEAARQDAHFASVWPWGVAAAAFHFGIKDPEYQKPAMVSRWMEERIQSTPQVPIVRRHDPERARSCGEPNLGDPLLRRLRERRSSRAFDPKGELSLTALGDCLFAGLGIVGWFDSGATGEAPLPLGMTPSGGARNPYEAYVRVARVSSLAPGIHHYSGVDHSFQLESEAKPSIAELLGGQDWFDAAAAVIFLVAHLDRTAWKYPHPGALRVVLLEAGHIAQNVLVVASARGLAAAPTCALSDTKIEAALGLDPALQAAVYAIALGLPASERSESDPSAVRYEPRFA